MENIEKKEEIDYNKAEAKFDFGDVCPPIQSIFFLDKEKEKKQNDEHAS